MPATDEQLRTWAEDCLHVNGHGAEIQRALETGDINRARDLAARAENRTWRMYCEMVAAGAKMPDNFRKPTPLPPRQLSQEPRNSK
jgi:hypothetical protein